MGRHPELRSGEVLHITSGGSVAGSLRSSALDGLVLAWDDVLHEGPLLVASAAELRSLRAAFLADHGRGDADLIAEEMRRRDELLDRALREAHPVVLWFEHDLFDQLQLLQVLAAMPPDPRGTVELVQAETYLGPLVPPELEALWSERQPVTTEMIVLGHAAWSAVCSGEIEQILRRDTSPLPYLAAALERLLEERESLPRTKRQLLQRLADGPATPPELFVANQRAEQAIFLGDTWCYLHVYELVESGLVEPVGGGRMPLPPPRGNHNAFTAIPLQLTAEGRRLV